MCESPENIPGPRTAHMSGAYEATEDLENLRSGRTSAVKLGQCRELSPRSQENGGALRTPYLPGLLVVLIFFILLDFLVFVLLRDVVVQIVVLVGRKKPRDVWRHWRALRKDRRLCPRRRACRRSLCRRGRRRRAGCGGRGSCGLGHARRRRVRRPEVAPASRAHPELLGGPRLARRRLAQVHLLATSLTSELETTVRHARDCNALDRRPR
jgi:hypothetical protein